MRIIGIKILAGNGKRQKSPVEVMKGLKPGWFPFGNYTEPEMREGHWTMRHEPTRTRIYDQKNGQLKISVHAIVGKNGSGKTTLLDYLMMIMNNAARELLIDQYAPDEQKPDMARGVYAELYFETNNGIKCIRCIDTTLTQHDGNSEVELKQLNQHERYRVASELSYLVLCNYGLYSLNSHDYLAKSKLSWMSSKVNGDWLNAIYNLEQNYLFPITITPYRQGGIIDVNQMQDESMEKMVALMMYSNIKGNAFLDGYKPERINYQLRKGLGTMLAADVEAIGKSKGLNRNDLIFVKTAIMRKWIERLQCADLYDNTPAQNEEKPYKVFSLLLEYMATHTLRLCVYYDKFRRLFSLVEYTRGLTRRKRQIAEGEIEAQIRDELLEEIEYDRTNLTYGIRKCRRTVLEVVGRGLSHHGFLTERGSMPSANFQLRDNEGSLLDVLMLMPPPIYQLDVVMKKNDEVKYDDRYTIQNRNGSEIRFSKLSSGEKQWLYVLTTALFHIKSLEETVGMPKGINYNHVCLCFDEAELYYHPQFQRDFVDNLMKYITWLDLNPASISSIQVVIATHSPFILSDVMKDNILFLKEGQDYRQTMDKKEQRAFNHFNTFGANYYDLLKYGFFLEDNAIGKFVGRYIEYLRLEIADGRTDDELRKEIGQIADPLIRGYLEYELGRNREVDVQDRV